MIKYLIAFLLGAAATFAGVHYAHSQPLAPTYLVDDTCVSPDLNSKNFAEKAKENGITLKLERTIDKPLDIQALKHEIAVVTGSSEDRLIQFDRVDMWTSSGMEGTYFLVVYKDGCQVGIKMSQVDEWQRILKEAGLELRGV